MIAAFIASVVMALICAAIVPQADCCPRESVMRNLSARLFVMVVDDTVVVMRKHDLVIVDILD